MRWLPSRKQPEQQQLVQVNRAERRRMMRIRAQRPAHQGGGLYTKQAPAARRQQRRAANRAARSARRANRPQ